MTEYFYPGWQGVLKDNDLDGFDELWSLQAALIEDPNADRGGSSGVCRIRLGLPGGKEVGAYLKRQRSHTRKTLRHPLRGESTFAREFHMLNLLHQAGIKAPLPIYFGERVIGGQLCAILLTEELTGFRPLEEVMPAIPDRNRFSFDRRRTLLAAIAETVHELHDAGIHHRSLYPKHVFVRETSTGFDVAVIDLEKSRKSLFPCLRTVHDLSTLDYRMPLWSRSERLFFYKRYLGLSSLGLIERLQLRWIIKRSAARRSRLKGD
ncbi:MAG TPA: lipopolysaccharide kinase InaA family protein [Methylophilaceae bacterium]|nr:lipopolysaccharide kinase InaA family protein [Methylophilaceae bacterium]